MDIIHLPGLISYEDGLRLQEETVDDILIRTKGDTIYLLEHQPVYTIGRLRDRSSLRDPSFLPHPVHETNRGGRQSHQSAGRRG